MTDTVQYRKYLPDGIDKEPETVLEALIAARGIIVEEGRWMQGEWFYNKHPDVNPEDPFCNSWSVCAEGAVGLVTMGVRPINYYGAQGPFGDDPRYMFDHGVAERDVSLYRATNEALRQGAIDLLVQDNPDGVGGDDGEVGPGEYQYADLHDYYEGCTASVAEYNDGTCQTRTQAIAWFDQAIALEQAKTGQATDA